MNPHCFGPVELALPQNWDVAFSKNPLGNKGLMVTVAFGLGIGIRVTGELRVLVLHVHAQI